MSDALQIAEMKAGGLRLEGELVELGATKDLHLVKLEAAEMLLDSLSRQYWSCVQTSQDAPSSNPAICAPDLQPPDCGPADLLTC